MNENPARKTPTLLLLLAAVGVWALASSGGRSGGLLWRLRELRRAFVDLGHGRFSAPDSTALTGIALLLGAPVLCFGVVALRRRLRRGLAATGPGDAKGCAGLGAGAVLFTLLAPLALIGFPWLAPLAGLAFAVRFFSLLPERGRLARSRKVLLAGVAIYWFLYAAYEAAMARWSASVSGAIRVDILVYFPLLFYVTAAGVWLSFDRWAKAPVPP